MEPENTQQQKGVEHPYTHGQPTPAAPASLLAGVLGRIEQRNQYLTAQPSRQELIQALEHAQWEIRAGALRSLAESAEQAPLDLLISALQDEHRMVRVAAVSALGKLGERAPLDQLMLALQDQEWEVREMVVLVLGELGEQVPRSLLLAASHDTNASVREAASYALSGGRPQRKNSSVGTDLSCPPVGWFGRLSDTINRSLQGVNRGVRHHWSVFMKQLPILNKSMWIGTPLIMFFWCILTFLPVIVSHADIHDAALQLALFTTISAAAGTAFIYGGENDAGLELTLSTPTSMRIVMFYRFLLVVSYNILLSACASAVLALTHGGGVWEIVQIWLGPMLLVSSLTLTLSLMIGSWFALLAGLILEFSQAFVVNIGKSSPAWELVSSNSWQTTPTILLLALLCIVFAILYAPRQPRLAS